MVRVRLDFFAGGDEGQHEGEEADASEDVQDVCHSVGWCVIG